MKKNYTLSLDQEKVEELQKHLAKFGITFSGLINGLLDDINDDAISISFIMNDSNLSFKKARDELYKNSISTIQPFY